MLPNLMFSSKVGKIFILKLTFNTVYKIVIDVIVSQRIKARE
jgi:hypothetical protein